MKTIEEIIKKTAQHFEVTIEQMKQKSYTKGAKKKEIVIARQTAMVLLKLHTNLDDIQITGLFQRERTLIYDAVTCVKDLRFSDKNFDAFFKELEKTIIALTKNSEVKHRYVWDKKATINQP